MILILRLDNSIMRKKNYGPSHLRTQLNISISHTHTHIFIWDRFNSEKPIPYERWMAQKILTSENLSLEFTNTITEFNNSMKIY